MMKQHILPPDQSEDVLLCVRPQIQRRDWRKRFIFEPRAVQALKLPQTLQAQRTPEAIRMVRSRPELLREDGPHLVWQLPVEFHPHNVPEFPLPYGFFNRAKQVFAFEFLYFDLGV